MTALYIFDHIAAHIVGPLMGGYIFLWFLAAALD